MCGDWVCSASYLLCRRRILKQGLYVCTGQLIAGAVMLRLSGRSMTSQPWLLRRRSQLRSQVDRISSQTQKYAL